MKTFLFPLLFLFVFLFFSSCNEHESTVSTTAPPNNFKSAAQLDTSANILSKKKMKEWPTEIYDSTYGLITIDPNAIVPMAGECGIKVFYGWSTDHYEAKPGKIVGVWPVGYSVASLTDLRLYNGYSGIYINEADQDNFNSAISAGYSLNKIMIGLTNIPDAQRASKIDQFGNAFGYYVDEPADQDHSLGGIRSALLEYQFSSLFVISGYKRTYGLNVAVEQTDKVLFASYHHWWECLPGIWCTVDELDQRPDWSDMKSRYGGKFSMTWINTTEISEFDGLFGHAKNLGLDGVWIYSLDGHHTDQFGTISWAAWHQGFLRKFEQYVAVEWQCDQPNPCVNCDPTDPEAGWYVYRVYPLGQFREVFP